MGEDFRPHLKGKLTPWGKEASIRIFLVAQQLFVVSQVLSNEPALRKGYVAKLLVDGEDLSL